MCVCIFLTMPTNSPTLQKSTGSPTTQFNSDTSYQVNVDLTLDVNHKYWSSYISDTAALNWGSHNSLLRLNNLL